MLVIHFKPNFSGFIFKIYLINLDFEKDYDVVKSSINKKLFFIVLFFIQLELD